MISFSLWSAEEIREFIRNLDLCLVSGATHVQGPDGQVNLQSLGSIAKVKAALERRLAFLEGRPAPRRRTSRTINTVFVNGYGAHYRHEREAEHGQREDLRALGAEAARMAKEQHAEVLAIINDWDWS